MSNARIHTGHGHNSKAGHDRKRFARRRHDIVISFLLASGLVAALAVFAQWGVPWLSQAISNTALNTPDVENLQIGTLTVQTDGNECELMKFDNATGRTIENTARCRKDVTLDAHGAPVPMGTVHRLDAISKSFSAGQH
ncbi:MAG TPA: hypothetical protein VIY68_00945 [Steroidobacteraceae bacterium]